MSRGLAWVGAASSVVGLLGIVSMVVVLRWITPAELGIATLGAWMFPILDHATDLGLSGALIQRDEHDEDLLSTVFWINAAAAATLFALLLALAPPLARAVFGHEVVGWMLVAYGSKLLWQNLYFIPHALMKRDLRFAELSLIRAVANVAECAGTIGAAVAGAGVWCFVIGSLCRVAVTGVAIQLRRPWRPRWVLRLRPARPHLAFGLRTSCTRVLFQVYTNLDYPIVGFFFGPAALGAYRVAYEVVLEPVKVISDVIVAVAFPVFARQRHDRALMIDQLVSFTRLNLVTVMTYTVIAFVAAGDILALLFPDYTSAAPAVRILCAVAVLRAVSFVVPALLEGAGHASRSLRYTVAATVVMPLAFAASAWALGPSLGYASVAVAWAVAYPIAFAVLIYLAMQTLDWSARAYFARIAPTALAILVAGSVGALVHAVAPAQRLALSALATLATAAALLAPELRAAVRSLRSG
ncbi:MAG: oligosaccharide flippase family protein [Deltaproteobacteria bacterium]|nr:oligosaccharide flippase family protein [Deltaproteobacteria bacterium]